MNILIAGGGPGSWAIRGGQLGGALGARVVAHPSSGDYSWADVIVLVKRAISQFRDQAVQTGKPVVWDALDFWQQPTQNGLAVSDAIALARRLAGHGVTILGATQAMAAALGGHYLPHHAWPGLTPAPARASVKVVAYQGAAHYLGRWQGWLTKACADRGWQFVVNPRDLREADLLVAFRDGEWDGAICREWKSGVKAVNAIAAGRPLLTQDGAAVREIAPEGAIVETPEALGPALDDWADYGRRTFVAEVSRDRALPYRLASVAAHYRTVLEAQTCPA
jgi:hypothetical protein